MDDFAVAPGVPNAFKLVQAKANEIAPGKRPLSSMSPMIAMRDGRPAMVVGGAGGPTIISGVLQVTLDALDLRMNAQDAVGAARIHEQAQPTTVFVEQTMPQEAISELGKMGYTTKVVPELGAVSAIKIAPGMLDGAFDPRKGGAAVGN
jgi:gamma-glutamyltranspeptidase/glutathione hydrolase